MILEGTLTNYFLATGMSGYALYVVPILAIVGLAYMAVKRTWVLKQDSGDGKMQEISQHIY